MPSSIFYLAFGLLSVLTIVALGYGLFSENKLSELYLPGETSSGHYQIEMKCSECHDPWKGVTQEACLKCHEEELTRVKDTHPQKKFRDPRNANKLEQINVMLCTTCHKEHRPRETREMGVTLPLDYCAYCHQDIAEERPTHQNLEFNSCQTSGCHNYHDNQGTYTAFLEKHTEDPWLFENRIRPVRDSVESPQATKNMEELVSVPGDIRYADSILLDYKADIHFLNDVSCKDCHLNAIDSKGKNTAAWNNSPVFESCKNCHEIEAKGFLEGRHGMRLAQGLAAMKVSDARIPMQESAAHRQMDCSACHQAHDFNTKRAAVESCMECHASNHVKNYTQSKHYTLWQKELAGEAPAGSGVSCASCHMPRIETEDSTRYWVDHNQNNNLRPNEKMIRTSCLNCHGLPFSLQALADSLLIENNFNSQPSQTIKSIDWVISQMESKNPNPPKKQGEANEKLD